MLMLLCYQCLLYVTFHFAFLLGLTNRNTVLCDLACKEALSTDGEHVVIILVWRWPAAGTGQPAAPRKVHLPH